MSQTPNASQALTDEQYIAQTLELAKKGLFGAAPNPMVGCVLVKDGSVIGEGWHERVGQDHAERMAIANASQDVRGATAYISLEPCCHQGRTPPCTDALIDAGVSRVVAAMSDPNPMVSGGGFDVLRAAGIEVVEGVLRNEAVWLNRGFVKRMKTKKPWVRLKSAATLDGRTASYSGESKWITGESARSEVQELRAQCSAVVTGIGTVIADNPAMNVRSMNIEKQPYRILLDSNLRLPLDAKIIGDDGMLHVFTCSSDNEKISQLNAAGVEVIAAFGSSIDLQQVLDYLAKLQCNNILVEAGQDLSGSFLQNNLVDELVIYYAPSVLGSDGCAMFAYDSKLEFEQRGIYKFTEVEVIGNDIRVNAVNPDSLQALQG